MKKVLFLLGTFDSESGKTGEVISKANFGMLNSVAKQLGVEVAIEWVVPDTTGEFIGKDSDINIGRLDKATGTFKKGTIRFYRDYVLKCIKDHAPDVVMACGTLPLKFLLNKGCAMKDYERTQIDVPDLPGVVCAVTKSIDMVNAKPGTSLWYYLDTLIALEGIQPTQWGGYTVMLPTTKNSKTINLLRHRYPSICFTHEWAKMPAALKGKKAVGLDLETFPGLDPWHPDARIRMCVISDRVGRAWVVQAKLNSALPAWVRSIAEDKSIMCGGSNIKFDYKWLKRFGITLTNMFDTSTAEHVIDCTQPFTDLKSLTFIYCPKLADYSKGHRDLLKARGGKDRWDLVDDDEQYDYCGGDGEASVAAMKGQLVKLKDKDLMRPFNISMGVYKVLAEMEERGACVSLDVNEELRREFDVGLTSLRQELLEVLGPFNPNSPAQLAGVLKATIPDINLSKHKLARQLAPKRYSLKSDKVDDDYSTDKEILNREAHKHPIIATLLQYRRYATLNNTFVEGLRNKHMVLHPDGRYYVHTSYRTDKVETYRLSSQGPNLQNIPRKPDPDDPDPIPLHLNIKRQYVSRFPGGSILEADLSQAEIRIAAHLSQDPLMMEAVTHGDDIHRAMTSKFKHKAEDDVTSLERTQGKSQNFLVIYGGGANTLSKKLEVHKNVAKQMMNEYFNTFSGLKDYMEKCGLDVMRDLYSESEFGYIRGFRKPDNWENYLGHRIRRQAWNHKVQNGAACCVFVAKMDLNNLMNALSMRSLIDMQVHDSIKIDVYPGEEHDIAFYAKHCLENPSIHRFGVKLTVPLVADVEIGPSWGEMEKVIV